MLRLYPISHESVPGALAKAEHYRLLSEPAEAESICRDILAIEPDHQQAMICLVLALSDQIGAYAQAHQQALAMTALLKSAYDKAYYTGIVWERRAKARYASGGSETRHWVYDWIIKALKYFEEAERLRPPGNDDSVLRWNTCVRFLERHRELTPHIEEPLDAIRSE